MWSLLSWTKTLLFLPLTLIIGGCSIAAKERESSLYFPQKDPVANITNFTPVLACVGQKINESPIPGIDIYISPIPDDTTPFDMSGSLVKDATMMATTAFDRFGTNKISVVGQNVQNSNRAHIQLVSSFTELNKTTRSKAHGFGFSIGDFSADFGKDETWDHVAMDLALTQNGRLISGKTASVAISVLGENGEGNIRVGNSDYQATVSLGTRGQEGLHAAQRVLIELGLAVIMSHLYQVDYQDCLPNPQNDPMKDLPDKATHDHGKVEQTVFTPAQPQTERILPVKMSAVQGQVCGTDSLPPAITDDLKNAKWSHLWNGNCVNGQAQGMGELTWFFEGTKHSQVFGEMNKGLWIGDGHVIWKNGNEYYGDLTGRESGYYFDHSDARTAKLKLVTGQLYLGATVKLSREQIQSYFDKQQR